jgi:two-component system, sensor histidine kinase and response regulator
LASWDAALSTHLEQERVEAQNRLEAFKHPPQANPLNKDVLYYIGGLAIEKTMKYVLVVEDNKMISMILEETLQTMGFKGVIAENGRIAVDKFTEFLQKGCLFELILMDIIMPEMGGYESTQLIRQAEETFQLQPHERHFICGFSAEVNAVTREKCKNAGMNDILSKPMKKETL